MELVPNNLSSFSSHKIDLLCSDGTQNLFFNIFFGYPWAGRVRFEELKFHACFINKCAKVF